MLFGGWHCINTYIGCTNWPHWIIKRGHRGLGGVKMGSGGWILLKYTVYLWNSQGIKRNNNNKDIKSIPFFKLQGCRLLVFKYKLAHFIYLPLRWSAHKVWPILACGREDMDKAFILFDSMFCYVSMRCSIILSDVLIHHTALSMVLLTLLLS